MHDYCREYLKEIMALVRKHFNRETIKNGWAYNYGDGQVEFQINKCSEIPEGFYWNGRGCCLWSAKAEGWEKYLHKMNLID